VWANYQDSKAFTVSWRPSDVGCGEGRPLPDIAQIDDSGPPSRSLETTCPRAPASY